MTNATKAGIIAVLNSGLGLLVAFDVALTQAQLGALDTFANAVLGVWVALTYRQSVKRVPGS